MKKTLQIRTNHGWARLTMQDIDLVYDAFLNCGDRPSCIGRAKKVLNFSKRKGLSIRFAPVGQWLRDVRFSQLREPFLV